MTLRSVLPDVSRTTLCVVCWAWVISAGTAMIIWNVQAGYPGRAKVVGLLMLLGAAIYVFDMLSTVYGKRRQAS